MGVKTLLFPFFGVLESNKRAYSRNALSFLYYFFHFVKSFGIYFFPHVFSQFAFVLLLRREVPYFPPLRGGKMNVAKNPTKFCTYEES